MAIQIRPITPTIGAEIVGVDFSRIDDATVKTVRQALLDHMVLVFRGLQLDPAQHVSFARCFGDLDPPHPVRPHVPGASYITIIESRDGKGTYPDSWHIDVTFRKAPPMGAALYARIIPESGGDTLWTNMCAAYDGLSERVKRMIDGLMAMHDISGGPQGRTVDYRDEILAQPDGLSRLQELQRNFPPIPHPVVRTHPETGRRSLFICRNFVTHIEGLSKLESERILSMLYEHCEQVAFQMRHRWQANDLVMWDNRCTTHFGVTDYKPAHRLMHRVSIQGDVPFYRESN